jgi:hypothetical protein
MPDSIPNPAVLAAVLLLGYPALHLAVWLVRRWHQRKNEIL